VLEIRDIWPESIEAVGAMQNRLVLRYLQFLERRLYQAADRIVTVGKGYRDRIVAKLGDADRVSVITNGVDLEQFSPCERVPEFRRHWNLDGAFVCSYVGTIGMAHGLDVVLRAAQIFKNNGELGIRFLLVGDGACRQRLQDKARTLGVDDLVIFTGRLPKEEMPRVLAGSDACLIHLRRCELFGSVIPSKLFEILAMGRPIIMGVGGEALDIVMDSGAGLEMEPESAESLVACIEKLKATVDLEQQLARKARRFVADNYSRDALAARYLELLNDCVEPTAVTRPSEVPSSPHVEVPQS
jgi:glycosyltransferase involved in cell wall biosynthesis